MEEKKLYPKLFEMWSPMQKICWIQREYGVYDEEEDTLLWLRADTPEEIKSLYNKLWDELEPLNSKGFDID